MLLDTQVREVQVLSGQRVRVVIENSHGRQAMEGTDLLVATGRTPITQGIGLEAAGIELDTRSCHASKVWTEMCFGSVRIVSNPAIGRYPRLNVVV
jgi:pyruvate/2-oxoglutarate dehydrogenase complex dihydrolipoamide dehydrogenase (E3) component